MISGILVAVMTTLMIFFLVINSFQALLLMCSVPELWSHWQLADDEYFHALVGSESLPPISIVAPVRKSRHDVAAFAQMLLDLEYPRLEVILVVDGSSGDSLRNLTMAMELYQVPPAFTINLITKPVEAYFRSRLHPRLLCLDLRGGTVADALNAGINAARYPHALVVEQNVTFERDALLRLSRPFLLDRSVVCVGGLLRAAGPDATPDGHVSSGHSRGWAAQCQRIEYLRLFTFQRLGWNRIASNLVFPGNTVLFKREHVFGMGGFDPSSETPGLDLAIGLHKHLTDSGINPTMPVIPDLVAWSRIRQDIRGIGRARQRWVSGLSKSLARHKTMFANPEYGAFGMIAVPYLWLALLIAPVLELAGYAGLVAGLATGVLSSAFAWAYLASVVGYGILLSIWTVVFQAVSFRQRNEPAEIVRLLAFAVVESLGYRQILAVYRATALFSDRQPRNLNGQPSPSGAA